MKKLILGLVLIASFAPLAASADPNADFQKVAKVFGSVHSFKANMNHGSFSVDLVYVAPNRFKITAPSMQRIIIGSDAYMKLAGHWRKVPAALSGAQMGDMIRKPFGASTVRVSAEKSGLLSGVPVKIFTWTRPDAPGVTATTYVDARSHLPLKNVVAAPSSTTVVTYSDYNAPLAISPPPGI